METRWTSPSPGLSCGRAAGRPFRRPATIRVRLVAVCDGMLATSLAAQSPRPGSLPGFWFAERCLSFDWLPGPRTATRPCRPPRSAAAAVPAMPSRPAPGSAAGNRPASGQCGRQHHAGEVCPPRQHPGLAGQRHPGHCHDREQEHLHPVDAVDDSKTRPTRALSPSGATQPASRIPWAPWTSDSTTAARPATSILLAILRGIPASGRLAQRQDNHRQGGRGHALGEHDLSDRRALTLGVRPEYRGVRCRDIQAGRADDQASDPGGGEKKGGYRRTRGPAPSVAPHGRVGHRVHYSSPCCWRQAGQPRRRQNRTRQDRTSRAPGAPVRPLRRLPARRARGATGYRSRSGRR